MRENLIVPDGGQGMIFNKLISPALIQRLFLRISSLCAQGSGVPVLYKYFI